MTPQPRAVIVPSTWSFCSFVKACDLDYLDGCFMADMRYEHGDEGVAKDVEKARSFYKKACDGGLRLACSSFEKL
jgi:TPR repeat protein